MNDYVFYIESVTVKRGNANFLVIEGNCTQSMRKFKIEYCGTEANNVGTAIIPEEYLFKFKEALKNDYGYPPYERKTVGTKFKNTEKRYGFNAD